MTLDMLDDPYIMKLINSYEQETGHINRNKLNIRTLNNGSHNSSTKR